MKFRFRRLFPFLFAWLVLGIHAGCTGQNDQTIQPIHYEEIQQKIADGELIQFIDVRTPEEFKEGSIPTARNMSFQDPRFPNMVAVLDKSRPVYLFCQSGNRSSRAARMLRDLGFEQVHDYRGGYRDWIQHRQGNN